MKKAVKGILSFWNVLILPEARKSTHPGVRFSKFVFIHKERPRYLRLVLFSQELKLKNVTIKNHKMLILYKFYFFFHTLM